MVSEFGGAVIAPAKGEFSLFNCVHVRVDVILPWEN